jgi:hypothetical protein
LTKVSFLLIAGFSISLEEAKDWLRITVRARSVPRPEAVIGVRLQNRGIKDPSFILTDRRIRNEDDRVTFIEQRCCDTGAPYGA